MNNKLNLRGGLTLDYLKECFYYHPDGYLVWREDRPSSHFASPSSHQTYLKRFAGKRAGTTDGKGYRSIFLKGKHCLEHRIIFFMHHGYCPPLIDHRDQDKANNRVENLREATQKENMNNRRPRRTSNGKYATGYSNIYNFPKVRSKKTYRVILPKTTTTPHRSGSFETLEEAVIERNKWLNEMGRVIPD